MGRSVDAMKLVDTDILIDVSRKVQEAIGVIDRLRDTGIVLSVSSITEMELIVGCRNKKELREAREFLDEFEILHLSESISLRAVELVERFHLSHGLSLPDALIGATAIMHDIELLSKNVRHFDMIEELKVSRPY